MIPRALPSRRGRSEVATPDQAPAECALVVHASATSSGWQALTLAGDEATVLELSWYGTRM